ncbi:hypothetical protein F0169_03240 [Pseudomonas sp. MAFF 212408]|uniref:Uncharacterized protein n=1 Tax=Pseudomonas kitaguniensis TaxID=2607908 RepID=A0A5N7KHI7_9PSED|nr:hypothetical protein [Pseudomonas kitaguniensis]MPR01175.1 hypothetical protein [Pseudomonas kitaguniensis]
MIVRRNINEPLRTGLSHEEMWSSSDHGLITCWEVGRKRAEEKPELAAGCKNGELPVLGWKGGVGRQLLKLEKFGSLKYLAQWQGLRGEDLDVDLKTERTLVCTKTKMTVTFTPDIAKYLLPV